MRRFLAFVLMTVASCLSAAQQPVWTVTSATIDARIQRQLDELAAQQHASIQFHHRVVAGQAYRPHAGGLLIQFERPQGAAAFLAELWQLSRGEAVEPTPELAREAYVLRATYSPGSGLAQIRVAAISAAGYHCALLRIPSLLGTPPDRLASELIPRPQSVRVVHQGEEVTIADYPSFPVRGIVEGFYGTPWSYDDRLDVLHFEGQQRMNTYIYAPKDDLYERKLWREPYPPEQMKRLGALVAAAHENFVHFTYAISPGLSMAYSSEAEFQTLARKLESISKLGVTDFALFLDDVPFNLVHPEDQKRFQTLARAHVFLINRLYVHLKKLSAQNRLTVCPTTYTNEWGSRDYLRELGNGVRPEISLDWTGTEVISSGITLAQAAEWGGYIRRKPLVWDNFPVNDGHPWRLILDPLRGREARLFTVTQGLVSNPMCQAHASMVPLETVADYLWNSAAYDPEKSQHHALVTQYGADALSFLAPILQIYAAGQGEEPDLTDIFEERRPAIDVPAIESQISRLDSALTAMKGQAQFKKLAPEIEPIPDVLRAQLDRILASPAFKHLPDGKILWDRNKHLLAAPKIAGRQVLDGDFSKWQSGKVYVLNRSSQLEDGEQWWKGPGQFSARVAFGWDEENLYIGVDVVDPQLYQPFVGRGVEKGDVFRLVFDSAEEIRTGRPVGMYDLYLSPGNFMGTKPSIYCDEDFFPPRPHPHDYDREIKTVWKKTVAGFSGDIVIPVSFFDVRFGQGREIRLSFGARKAVLSLDASGEDSDQIVFSSKEDKLFPVDPENPASLQEMVLGESSTP
jgi:hypothetical protein